MFMPFNKPTFKDPAEKTPLFPLTYNSLADCAGVKPDNMAEGWFFANQQTSWKEAFKYTQEISAEEAAQ